MSTDSDMKQPQPDAADVPAKRKWPRRVALAVVAMLAAAVAGFLIYTGDYYHAGPVAVELGQKLEAAGQLQETDGAIAVGDAEATAGIVLYPGAKVDAHAYVTLASELSERGYYCVIAKMPFNLAFFGIDSASALMADAPEVDTWWIAGHSLGGAMAAQFASAHADELEGVILLAAYAATDLTETDLEAGIIYGSNDDVLNRDALEQNEPNLSEGAVTEVIDGGNHAGFGNYGPQTGDGESTIGAEAQWDETAQFAESLIG